MNFYNEHAPDAAAWLRSLIAAGLIPPGDVDERSITEIQPHELTRYTQCHFFAGIGGWSLALQLAAWPATRPVWTGSCPCQPYSPAGKGLGDSDPRNLWPAFFRLIRECRPDVVFGEQVASAIGHGWLDGIRADLESADYALGAAVLGAHSVGAPHLRQRLYWVANANGGRSDSRRGNHGQMRRVSEAQCGAEYGSAVSRRGCSVGRLADTDAPEWRAIGAGRNKLDGADARWAQGHIQLGADGEARGVVLSNGSGRDAGRQASEAAGHGRAAESTGSAGGVEHADDAGRGEQCRPVAVGSQLVAAERPSGGFWDDFYVVPCADGKARRIGSGVQPLAHGIPGRVAQLRGLGNAIVPQVAAEFVRAFEEVRGLL